MLQILDGNDPLPPEKNLLTFFMHRKIVQNFLNVSVLLFRSTLFWLCSIPVLHIPSMSLEISFLSVLNRQELVYMSLSLN